MVFAPAATTEPSTPFVPPHLLNATRARRDGNPGGTHTYEIKKHTHMDAPHYIAVTKPLDTTKSLTLAPYLQKEPDSTEFNANHAFSIGLALGDDWNAMHNNAHKAESRYIPHIVADITTPDNETAGALLAQLVSGITSHAKLAHAATRTNRAVTWHSVATGLVVGTAAVIGAGLLFGFSLVTGLLGAGVALGGGIRAAFYFKDGQHRAAEQIVCGGSLLLMINGEPFLGFVRQPTTTLIPNPPTVTTIAINKNHRLHTELPTEWAAEPKLKPKYVLQDRLLQTDTPWDMVRKLVDEQCVSA